MDSIIVIGLWASNISTEKLTLKMRGDLANRTQSCRIIYSFEKIEVKITIIVI